VLGYNLHYSSEVSIQLAIQELGRIVYAHLHCSERQHCCGRMATAVYHSIEQTVSVCVYFLSLPILKSKTLTL